MLKAAIARSVTYLPPGETTSIEIEVDEGTVVGSCPLGRAAMMVSIVGAPASGPQVVPVAYGDKVHVHDVHEMAPGKIVFTLANKTSERGMFAVAVLPPGFDRAAPQYRAVSRVRTQTRQNYSEAV